MRGDSKQGRIVKIAGPAIVADQMEDAKLNDIVHVGEQQLLAEIIRIEGERAFLQVFEDTTGLRLDESVENTHAPLSVTLGPGLLGQVYDGIQRPLQGLYETEGAFLPRGISAESLDSKRLWPFESKVHPGDQVRQGMIIGEVMEKQGLPHRIMIPPGLEGKVEEVFEGERCIGDPVIRLSDGRELPMVQHWPVKIGRSFKQKLDPDELFLTGQRVIDALFPICLGGSAIIPGGFGTGKTVFEQSLAKCSNAEIIVYVGCGERGNEMTDVLSEFPKLTDPFTGQPMMERTILVANTSNMPVAAREASVYLGLTMAEYYRDMGYHVALLVDSTSRWAEAMREISSRMEEMPGEEGYPTYLSSRLAGFYERSGKVQCLGADERVGSVTIVGAVSPPGGDYSEPVTQSSQRVTGVLWALDAILAYRRHYPSINWHRSYSLYITQLEEWYPKQVSADWLEQVRSIRELLQQDAELQEVVQLVGPDALQAMERIVLETGRAIRDDFLQQNAFSKVDAFCSLPKQKAMMDAILFFYRKARAAAENGVDVEKLISLPQREALSRMKEVKDDQIGEYLEHFQCDLEGAIHELIT